MQDLQITEIQQLKLKTQQEQIDFVCEKYNIKDKEVVEIAFNGHNAIENIEKILEDFDKIDNKSGSSFLRIAIEKNIK